jgi:hypothetical protein
VYVIQTSPSSLYDFATLRIGTSQHRAKPTPSGHSERDNECSVNLQAYLPPILEITAGRSCSRPGTRRLG